MWAPVDIMLLTYLAFFKMSGITINIVTPDFFLRNYLRPERVFMLLIFVVSVVSSHVSSFSGGRLQDDSTDPGTLEH